MKLSSEQVEQIALLARIKLSGSELETLSEQLSVILDNFEILQQVDTTNVSPTSQSITLQNIVRDDKARPSSSQEEILSNAPQQETGYFKVKAVLE